MRSNWYVPVVLVLILFLACLITIRAAAQTTSTTSVVPNLVNYSGVLRDASGRVVTTTSGVTFLLYKDDQGGAPLWLETQNVTPDRSGHYTVQLGATRANGLPLDLFESGEARWLALQVVGETEQPRVLLVSVPYALKAGDAQTVGGLPASAFVLAVPASSATATSDANPGGASAAPPPASSNVTTTGGTVNTIPLFTTATNVQSSILTQTGSGAGAKLGVNTASPATTLDVSGTATVRGSLTLPATGTATATAGSNSQPQEFLASVFNSTTKTAVRRPFSGKRNPRVTIQRRLPAR